MELQAGFKPFFIIILLFMGFSPLAGNNHSAQEQPLSEVLDRISERYQVIITYNAKLLSNIDVRFEFRADEFLETAVNRALADTDLRYKQLTEKYYIVFRETRTNKKQLRKIQKKFEQIQKLEKQENIHIQQNVKDKRLSIISILNTGEELLAERSVSGTVKDENDVPLIGASVMVKGTSTGTVTDLNGK